MAMMSALELSEVQEDVTEVSSRPAASNELFQKTKNVASEVRKNQPPAEQAALDETSSSDSSDDSMEDSDSDSDSDYEEKVAVANSKVVGSAASSNESPVPSRGRSTRKSKKPARFSPTELTDAEGQASEGAAKKKPSDWDGSKRKERRGMSKAKLRTNISKHVEKKEEYKIKIKRLKDQLKEKDRKFNELMSANIEYEESVQNLQKQAFKLLDKHNTFAMPDEIVRTEFARIFAASKRCAGKWAIDFKDLPQECTGGLKLLAVDHLGEVFTTPRLRLALEQGKIAPKIALNAVMNCCLCTHFFSRPFGHLSTAANNVETALNWVQEMGRRAAGTDIHIWRAMTVQMLDPPEKIVADRDQECQNEMDKLKIALQICVLNSLLNESAVLLKACTEGEEGERRAELVEVFQEAQNLSVRLQAQNNDITSYFLAGLQKLSSKFLSTSKQILGHRALKLKGDDEDNAPRTELDGEGIDLVIEPLILARVVEQGRIISESKVWKEAVVWVVREAEMQKEKPITNKTSTADPVKDDRSTESRRTSTE